MTKNIFKVFGIIIILLFVFAVGCYCGYNYNFNNAWINYLLGFPE